VGLAYAARSSAQPPFNGLALIGAGARGWQSRRRDRQAPGRITPVCLTYPASRRQAACLRFVMESMQNSSFGFGYQDSNWKFCQHRLGRQGFVAAL
jgi:hypothetical protein